MKILLVHGWGYDAGLWDDLAACRPDLPLERIDLGFFGPAQTDLPQEPYIGIGHSLGFLWLLRQASPFCRALVAVNGFPRFTEASDFKPAVPPRLLGRMQQQFVHQPFAVLQDFWQRCGAPGPAQCANVEALLSGLSWLQDWDGRQELAAFSGSLRILASRQDAIVPAAMTAQAFAGHDIRWHESAGHILPRQDPGWLAAQLDQLWQF